MTAFKRIRLRNWRQFSNVSIDLHPRLTIITGSNGAGKSTILNICSQHFGYSRPYLSTPKRKKGGGISYDLCYFRPETAQESDKELRDIEVADELDEDEDQLDFLIPGLEEERREESVGVPIEGAFVDIGSITYDNNVDAVLGFQEHQTQAYGIQIMNQQHVPGVPISSHRTISAYQPVQGLSLQLVTLSNAYQAFWSEVSTRMNGGQSQFSPLYRMKESLIAMAAFGEGNHHLERNEELYSAFEGFGEILKKILPREIGFQKLAVRLPDIILKTRSGEFVLDASSGGVNAIIEIAWQLYLFSLSNGTFSATLDEPENHLHPSMQRSIMANLINAFPNVQFIVATHSPFIVSAVEDSRVYALKYVGSVGQSGLPSKGPRRVRSVYLDQTKKAGSASEILREVLGVSVSMPQWAEDRLEAIVNEFEDAEITSASLLELRSRLASSGFSEYYPEAVARLVADK